MGRYIRFNRNQINRRGQVSELGKYKRDYREPWSEFVKFCYAEEQGELDHRTMEAFQRGETTVITDEILDFQKTVLEWNETFGNVINPDTKQDLLDLYRNLTVEEICGAGEFLRSYMAKDDEGVIDALCDIIYTGFMYLNCAGKSFKKDEVLIDFFQDKAPDRYDILLLQAAVQEDEFNFFKHSFISMLNYYTNYYNIQDAFKRITESNYSKAIPTEKYQPKKVAEFLRKEGRYERIEVIDSPDGKYKVVRAFEDLREGKILTKGKIIKGDWYKSVEDLGGLSPFILNKLTY